MGGKLFDQTARDKAIISLTRIRLSGDRITRINALSDEDFRAIKNLSIELGTKILKTRETSSDRQDLALANFHNALDKIWSYPSKLPAVSFAGQLLQYYTIVCNKNFEAHTSYRDFTNFLQENSQIFGRCDKNPLVTEYKLIKIYNDLTHFTDATKGIVAPVRDMDTKIMILHEALCNLSATIETWKGEAPNNDYIHYLSFACNYCAAKAVELQYTRNSDLGELDKHALSETQQVFLKTALQNLKTIEEIKEEALDKDNTATAGEAYSFGRSVLGNLPMEDMSAVQGHLRSLSS